MFQIYFFRLHLFLPEPRFAVDCDAARFRVLATHSGDLKGI